MKKAFLFLILFSMFLLSACMKDGSERKDNAQGVNLYRKGSTVTVVAKNDCSALEVLLSNDVNVDMIKLENNFSVIRQTEKGTLIALAKMGGIKEGEELFTLNGIENVVDVKVVEVANEQNMTSENLKRNGSEILLGDFNNDDVVDVMDFNIFKNKFGSSDVNYDIGPASKGTGSWADIYCYGTKDAKVDLKDLVVFVANFGKTKPVTKQIVKIEIQGSKVIEIKELATLDIKVVATYSDGTTDSNVQWRTSKEGVISYTKTSTGAKVTGVKGTDTVQLTAYAQPLPGGSAIEDFVTITVTKDEPLNTINIYVHKNFANGIYAWVNSTPIFGAWPGKTITEVYAKNTDYYEVIITDKTTISYLLLKAGNKVTAENQTATIGDVTWDENGNKNAGKPTSNDELKFIISPEKTKYKGTDTISIEISGGTITAKSANIDGKAITFSGNKATITVADYVADKATGTLVIAAENQEIGTGTKTFTISRDDFEPVIVNDIDNLRIYQVMVCSFMDGDPGIGYDWQWAGYRANGDLQGVINSLDYIKSLGMNAVWMTPIFETYSGQQAHNGYFANDYFNVDPKFGSNDTFRRLVDTAHEKGIYVILDGVMGHNAGSDIKSSPLSGKTPSTSNPVNYQDGGNSLQFYKDVVYHWIREYKIDGWRFDQSYQLGPGDGGDHKGQGAGNFYWDDIRLSIEKAVSENKAEGNEWGILGYQVGEDWDGEQGIVRDTYGTNEQGLHSAFDFPTRYRLVQTLAREEHGKEVNDASNLNYDHSMYPAWAHPNMFMGNHDLARFGDLINFSTKNNNYWKRHKAAISYLGAFTGPVTVYYGEEWGSKTGNSDLKSMHVSRNDGKISGFTSEEQDLINYTAKIMTLRAENPALWRGKRTNLKAAGNQYIDLKEDGNTKIVYCLNIGTGSESFNVTVSGSKLTDLISGESFTGSGSFTVPMEGLQARYLIVQ